MVFDCCSAGINPCICRLLLSFAFVRSRACIFATLILSLFLSSPFCCHWAVSPLESENNRSESWGVFGTRWVMQDDFRALCLLVQAWSLETDSSVLALLHLCYCTWDRSPHSSGLPPVSSLCTIFPHLCAGMACTLAPVGMLCTWPKASVGSTQRSAQHVAFPATIPYLYRVQSVFLWGTITWNNVPEVLNTVPGT